MKLVSTILLCLFCLVASAQNDTTKYFRSLDYGWSYKRLQAREAFIMPVDTFVNKLGMALLNNKLYSGNGIKWTLINGGTTIDTTKYIKYTDSAAMLNSYLRKIDTASLSNRINLKLNATDTASLSNRINLKLNITDTSTLQSESLAAYSFQANKTNITANATANTFKDTSGTYSGTITYVGTQPTGTTNHSFRYTQVGKMCTININLSYTTANSVTSVTLTLPPTAATPVDPAGMGANSEFVYPGYGMTWSVKAIPTGTGLNSARTCWMRKNGSGVYEMVIFNYSAASTIFLSGTVIYWTN